MCRHFHLALKPLYAPELQTNDIELAQLLRDRMTYATRIVESCSKRNTKAGYDAAGFAVLTHATGTIRPTLTGAHDNRVWSETCGEREFRVSRDGGDLLNTWPDLLARLDLDDRDIVLQWQSHIRQASQGDLYSAANAHPHREYLPAARMRIYSPDESSSVEGREAEVYGGAYFAESHNGDILDAADYKRFLEAQGFVFRSDSDSCVAPALTRFLFEHLTRDTLEGALLALAGEATDDAETDSPRTVILRKDRRGTARSKVEKLIELAAALTSNGAARVTVASALVGRILEYSNPENKFALQCLSPDDPEATDDCIGIGTYNLVRGGSGEGGQPGGEAVFYVPQSYDEENYRYATAFVGSEENSLKDVVALLDPEALATGELRPATVQEETIDLGDYHATVHLKEGVLPVYDIRPGELLEILPRGGIRLFDIYTGAAIAILAPDPLIDDGESDAGRHARWADLKVFSAEYEDREGAPIPCPFNKYGEEILIVEPFALRKNTQRLFETRIDGSIGLRDFEGAPLGLRFGTDDPARRAKIIGGLRDLTTVGAGTSFLISQVAEGLSRLLKLNGLNPTVIEGFTGSCAPPPLDERSLVVACSNSGGTSDVVRFVEEVACRTPGRAAAASPWLFTITNIESSTLGGMAGGTDPRIARPAGLGVMDLPEEECVGSTFAALASLQWLVALHTYLGEVRGEVTPEYAASVYRDLASLPDAIDALTRDRALSARLEAMATHLAGSNYDFIYTDYLPGVAEEQAHKGAEMIQEMFVGFHYFMFQHGKYAHVKQKTLRSAGSIVVHNVPPRTLPVLNQRAKKAPMEIKARAGNLAVICHESDRAYFERLGEYTPDYIFTYPSDHPALYPFQTILIAQELSFVWGERKREIGQQIKGWGRELGSILLRTDPLATALPPALREEAELACSGIRQDWTELLACSNALERVEHRRIDFVTAGLDLLSSPSTMDETLVVGRGVLGAAPASVGLRRALDASVTDRDYLSLLKELALELSNRAQAAALADHFLGRGTDGSIRTEMYAAYEGLGALFDVDPIHPPKIAKAKKGWL